MTQEKSSRKILKATMEAVFQSQERLRKHLDELVKENRCLKDQQERDTFFREVSYSTLGLGIEQIIEYKTKEYSGIRKDVETVARWLAYQTTNKVIVPLELYKPGNEQYKEEVPICKLWQVLRDNLFSVFPLSLDRACSISKERDEQIRSKGYAIQ